MPTLAFRFDLDPSWKLAATGPVSIVLTTVNGPATFFFTAAAVPPVNDEGHQIKEGESITLTVKATEFLYVKADRYTELFVG